MTDTKYTIVLVDDHEVVRKGVRAYLESTNVFEVVGEASNGETALTVVAEQIPDLVLLDLIMPGMSGVEAIRRLKQASPRSQIVVLTSYHEDIHIFPALKAGAISYILKDIRMEKLGEALRAAAEGTVTLHPLVAAKVLSSIRNETEGDSPLVTDLSDRELDVLKKVAQGLSNRMIAEELSISEYTVKGHVSNILSKLHLADRTQAAVFAWQTGLVK